MRDKSTLHDNVKKEPRKEKLKPVVNGKKRQKNKAQKMMSKVLPDGKDLKSFIVNDVMIPTLRRTIFTVVEEIIYPGGSGKRKGLGSRISYDSYYGGRDRFGDRTSRSNKDTGRRNYDQRGLMNDDIVVDTRGEAEEVLLTLGDALDKYGFVTVADLYDLVAITAAHTDHKYGWYDINAAEVARIRDGYAIKMPTAQPID